MAISATRPRADVAYCIHALARRLSKTHNWAVLLLFYGVVFVKSHSALKLLLMIFFFFFIQGCTENSYCYSPCLEGSGPDLS